MSLKLLNIEFKQDFSHPDQKSRITSAYVSILKVLAQAGQDSKDGKSIKSIFLSQDSVCRKTKCSRPTVQRALNCFEDLRWLVFIKKRARGVNQYEMDLVRLNEFLDVVADLNPKVQDQTHVRNSAASFGNSAASFGKTAASQRDTDPFVDPFLYNNKKNKLESERQTSSPSFTPVDKVRENSKADLNFDKKSQKQNMDNFFKSIGEYLPHFKVNH